jgi:hypothetical protein
MRPISGRLAPGRKGGSQRNPRQSLAPLAELIEALRAGLREDPRGQIAARESPVHQAVMSSSRGTSV